MYAEQEENAGIPVPDEGSAAAKVARGFIFMPDRGAWIDAARRGEPSALTQTNAGAARARLYPFATAAKLGGALLSLGGATTTVLNTACSA